MSIALIQPQFAPNLYDLASMLKADQVYWLDTDQWSRKGRSHRAKIRAEEGTQWINLPIRTEDKGLEIREVRIDHTEDWKEPFWNGVLHNYSSAVYFDHLQDEFLAMLNEAAGFEKLIDFNGFFFKQMLRYLEIDVDLQLISEVGLPELHGTEIFQEYDSRNYIRQLDEAGVALQEHPEYRQAWTGFEPECSIIDLLFNYGPESYSVIELLN